MDVLFDSVKKGQAANSSEIHNLLKLVGQFNGSIVNILMFGKSLGEVV